VSGGGGDHGVRTSGCAGGGDNAVGGRGSMVGGGGRAKTGTQLN
jgi:hypothetical protein